MHKYTVRLTETRILRDEVTQKATDSLCEYLYLKAESSSGMKGGVLILTFLWKVYVVL